ncbi:MAG: hypothetical protein Q8M96_14070, partial [Rubrivivax sp.]|nr:hypothetical protein [Rubrivivax sp.]
MKSRQFGQQCKAERARALLERSKNRQGALKNSHAERICFTLSFFCSHQNSSSPNISNFSPVQGSLRNLAALSAPPCGASDALAYTSPSVFTTSPREGLTRTGISTFGRISIHPELGRIEFVVHLTAHDFIQRFRI